MTPIHEMKTRKATWRDMPDAHCYGVFFEVDGREVGVVIRDQPEAVAKPLIEAIAALPGLAGSVLALVATQSIITDRATAEAITRVQAALKTAGVIP